MRRTNESGGVSGLRDTTFSNREEVMRNLLMENHNEDILCLRVSLSIFRAWSELSSMSFLTAAIVSFNLAALDIHIL